MKYVQHGPRPAQQQHQTFVSHSPFNSLPDVSRVVGASADHGQPMHIPIATPSVPMTTPAEDGLSQLLLALEQISQESPASDHMVDHQPPKPILEGISKGQNHTRTKKGSHRPRIDFEEFAAQVRLQRHHDSRLQLLRNRQNALQRAIALSARFYRTACRVYNGLVEMSRFDDKAGFVHVYHTMQELNDSLSTPRGRSSQSFDPIVDQVLQSDPPHDLDTRPFISRLPARSRADLFEFISLVRTNQSFLVDRLKGLSPTELAYLICSPKHEDAQESVLATASRGKSPASRHKRNVKFSNGLKEFALSLERRSPLSFLLFNVYGATQDPEGSESQLRLDVWSSVCANLFMDSEHEYSNILNEILNSFASLHEWRAKSKLELLLMDLLQKGAFLLEMVENPRSPQDFDGGFFDPFSTSQAKEFFEQAVQDLLELLDDQDGGLPYGALHFGSAVLGKLDTDGQSRFRGYLFYQWFFCEFLRISIMCPENEGMLLHTHVSGSARDVILYHVWYHAQARISDVIRMDPSKPAPPQTTDRVNRMVSRLIEIQLLERQTDNNIDNQISANSTFEATHTTVPASFLLLSAPELIYVLDALYPRPKPAPTQWDPFLNSCASTFAAQYSQMHTTSTGSPREASLSEIPYSGIKTPKASAGRSPAFPSSSTSALPFPSRISLLNQYDRLRRDLLKCTESAIPPYLSHGSEEPWSLVTFDENGNFSMTVMEADIPATADTGEDISGFWTSERQSSAERPSLDWAQKAAVRLINQHRGLIATPGSNSSFARSRQSYSLETLFEAELDLAQNRADTHDVHYWWKALNYLRKAYPLASLSQDDTKILEPLMSAAQTARIRIEKLGLVLENDFIELKNMSERLKETIGDVMERFDRLRDKMWYTIDVAHSDSYEKAKTVALALNNMAASAIGGIQQSNSQSRGRSQLRSAAGSLLQRPHSETISVMKAASEHGGPWKLADEQVEITKRWLQRNAIDNFCKGEERIHRFCMEVKLAAKKLVGETMQDSPVLWSSDLYLKERTLFDAMGSKPLPFSTVTRPSSIMSDELPLGHQFSHHSRAFDLGARLHPLDTQSSPGRKSSFHSLGSSRFPRELYMTDSSSLGGSPGPTISATTTESSNSIWSPLPTQAQSTTSISSHSRPASTYNDGISSKVADRIAPAKAKFLDNLRQTLVSLLLSDLGCPVWSCGSETDLWLDIKLDKPEIRQRIEKRNNIERLLTVPRSKPGSKTTYGIPIKSTKGKRSLSASPAITKKNRPWEKGPGLEGLGDATSFKVTSLTYGPILDGSFSYADAYRQLTDRFCRQSSPLLKLQALYDLKMLAISQIKERAMLSPPPSDIRPNRKWSEGGSVPSSRRSSLNPMGPTKSSAQNEILAKEAIKISAQDSEYSPNEQEIVQTLKVILLEARPKTLFRDLQFIAAFVPPDILSNTDNGKAFLHVGLAALAFKDEVCRSMVDVAGQIVARDSIKRKSTEAGGRDSQLAEAAALYIYAAKEGNAVAQRELASLYLTHPSILMPISLPLSLPRETFRPEMRYWQETQVGGPNPQAMCLALHWMQHAESNGDPIAQLKLQERKDYHSIQ